MRSWKVFSAMLMVALGVSGLHIQPGDAQAQAASARDQRLDYLLSTSGQGSSFYPLSVALTEAWKKSVPGLNVSLAPGGGAGSVIATGKGTAQIGMTLSSTAVDGVAGRAPFKEPYPDVRGLVSLDPQPIQYFAYRASGLKRIEDLAGKRVYVKPKNFAAHGINLMVLSAHGMSLASFSKAETASKPDAINLLKDGHLDALLWMGPAPDSLVMDASFNRPIQLLQISDAKMAELRKINAGMVPFVIPKGTYPGVDADFNTLSVPRVLVVSKNVPDDIAYAMTKAIVDSWAELKVADPGLNLVAMPAIATDFGVAYHPGAVRYFRERGWIK